MRILRLSCSVLRLSLMVFLVLCAVRPALSVTTADEKPALDEPGSPESASRKKQREENLKAMAERAAGSRIRLAANDGKKNDKSQGRLIPQPLFHYTDQPRQITDATLWGWTVDGRLLGICKIENYEPNAHPEGVWLYCFGSLARELVEAEFPDGHTWSARKPGIELRKFSGAPPAAEGRPARLRQMKDIAGRFSATIVNATASSSQEMRLLPRPIYRYERGVGELLDGTVFGLTTNGTSPDAVLVIELHQSEQGAPDWKFGVAGMTQEQLSVKFDGKEIWSKPYVRFAGGFDTWTFFWENQK